MVQALRERQSSARPADPAGEVVLSAVVLLAAYGAQSALFAAIMVGLEVDVALGLWVAPIVSTAVVGGAVAYRARDVRRRGVALGVMVISLVPQLVVPTLLGPSMRLDRLDGLAWLVSATGMVTGALFLVAWGVARRRGSWWWAGLVPAVGLALLAPHLQVRAVDLLPMELWVWALLVLSLLGPAVGGASSWLLDVLETRPYRGRGRLEA